MTYQASHKIKKVNQNSKLKYSYNANHYLGSFRKTSLFQPFCHVLEISKVLLMAWMGFSGWPWHIFHQAFVFTRSFFYYLLQVAYFLWLKTKQKLLFIMLSTALSKVEEKLNTFGLGVCTCRVTVRRYDWRKWLVDVQTRKQC